MKLQTRASLLLILLGAAAASTLLIQAKWSQSLVTEPSWHQMLQDWHARGRYVEGETPNQRLHSWSWRMGDPPPASMPAAFKTLGPGFYDDDVLDLDKGNPDLRPYPLSLLELNRSYAVFVTDLAGKRYVDAVDLSAFETSQNRSVFLSVTSAVLMLGFVAIAVFWLHCNLTRPVDNLAQAISSLKMEGSGERVAAVYRQKEIATIAAGVNGLLEKVDSAFERERKLIDEASHEFRTPLAVIAGSSRFLKSNRLEAGASVHLARIEDAVNEMNSTISILMSLSRHEPVDEASSIALAPAVATLLQALASEQPSKAVAVAVDIKHIGQASIKAPPLLLDIALRNLLRNALENAVGGAVIVYVLDGAIRIRNETASDPLTIAAVYKASLRNAGRRQGGGLGLLLVRKICDRLGWTYSLCTLNTGAVQAQIDFNGQLHQT